MSEMDLESAFDLLKTIVKKSEALDDARHFDLTLVPALSRPKFQSALIRVQKAIRTKEITQDYVEKRTTLKW